MTIRKRLLGLVIVLSLLANALGLPWLSVTLAIAAGLPVVDDSEAGLPAGVDANGIAIAIGFNTFQDPNPVTSVAIAVTAALLPGAGSPNYVVAEGGAATLTVKLSKPSADPVTIDYAMTFGPAIPDRDYTPASGTLTFAPNITQRSFTIQTIDDQKHQGNRGVLVELSGPAGGLALGVPPIARVVVQDNEACDPALLDDFETFPYFWSGQGQVVLSNPEIASGAPQALPGQGA